MDNVGSRGLSSISEQPAPQTPNVKRKLSLYISKEARNDHAQWCNPVYRVQFYERQRMTRHGMSGMLPRINSDNNLTFPADRRASAASVEDLEPRSKSVSQYHRMHMRRQSSPPGMLSYEDGGDISDTSSVALDDMFSPLSRVAPYHRLYSLKKKRDNLNFNQGHLYKPRHINH